MCIIYSGQILQDGTAGENDLRFGWSLIRALVEVQVGQNSVKGQKSLSLDGSPYALLPFFLVVFHVCNSGSFRINKSSFVPLIRSST